MALVMHFTFHLNKSFILLLVYKQVSGPFYTWKYSFIRVIHNFLMETQRALVKKTV